MSGKIDKSLVNARMYIEARLIDEPVEGDLNLALFGDEDARMRIEEAMARYRYADKEGSGELSTSGLSSAEIIADPNIKDLAKHAAIHGTLDQFLSEWNIIGRPEEMSASAASLVEKLVAKHCLSEKVLMGIAKAADAASKRTGEAFQTAGILINTYGRLLSRLIDGHFHPAQARAILDEFFGWKAFMVLSRMSSFDSSRWKRIKDEEKLDALAVYILDQFDTDKINDMANELTDRLAADPVYGDLSDWERSELAHYASIQKDPEKAMKVIGRLYKSQFRVEEGFHDTAFDNVANDVSRIAQFASDEEDAFRVANLMIDDAENLFRFTIEDIDDAPAMRLSVLAKIYASRMGITKTKTLVANISDNFKALQGHFDHQNRPEMELAFKASFSQDKSEAKKVFIRGKRILESANMDIEEFEFNEDDRDQALMAVVREMSLKDLENVQMALDVAKTTARQVAQKIQAETAAIGFEPEEEPAEATEAQDAREVPLEPVPIGPVAIGDGPYKRGDPMPDGVMKAIASIESGFLKLPQIIQDDIVEDLWNAATSSEENMRLIFRDSRLTVAALSHWRATAASFDVSVKKTLIGDREPTLGDRILPDHFEGDATEYLPRIVEEMRGIDTLFAKLPSETQERIAKAIVNYRPSPFQDGKLTVGAVELGHGLARGLSKKNAHGRVAASQAEPIQPVRPKPLKRAEAKSRASIPPPHSFDLRRTIMEKLNFGSAFIDEATTRMSETRDVINSRAALLTLINAAAQSLKDRFGVRLSVAFAILEEKLLSNADHYFERITALPLNDQDVLRQAIGTLSYELTKDVSKSSIEGHDVKVREVAIRLSKWIDAEDAVHMAATLAPFLVDDSDCERVIDNYRAVLAYLMGTIHKDSAKEIAKGVRLEGDEESAVESAKRYIRHLASVRSRPQFKGINAGRIAEIFNIALGMRVEYELATIRAADIAGTYMDALKTLGMGGIWHGADDLALYVSSYDNPSEPLEFITEAYDQALGYLESQNLTKNVEGRLAAVICKHVMEMNRSHDGKPTRLMRIYAAQYFDIYRNIYNELMYGGLEEGPATDRALALTSVYDQSRTPFVVRQEIARHKKPDGNDEGPGSGSAPIAGGAPQGTPTPPVAGGTEAKSSFKGIAREEDLAAPGDEFLIEAWMVDENSTLFPGIANQTTMVLGARVVLTASAL